MGNPLLDISAHVDQAFLDKYEVRFPPDHRQRTSCLVVGKRTRRHAVHTGDAFILRSVMQLKLADQILAEDKHQPLYKVRI